VCLAALVHTVPSSCLCEVLMVVSVPTVTPGYALAAAPRGGMFDELP